MSRNDLDGLGRLGRCIGPVPVASRSRRVAVRRGSAYVSRKPLVPRPALAVVAVTVLCLGWLGSAASRQALPDEPAAAAAVPARPVADRASRSRPGAQAFATVEGLVLRVVNPAPVMVAFHEATRAEALAMEPVGTLLANDNPTKFDAGPTTAGPEFRILSSRGRGRPATSAVDVALTEGAAVAAPVTGEVVEVRQYWYEGIQDWRVVISPTGHQDLAVVLIHLQQPTVAVGDRVVAGTTPLAAVRSLPFSSHIDYATGGHFPHTHIEVKPALGDDLMDPNQPAVAPELAQGEPRGD